jgi:hypothetical protein
MDMDQQTAEQVCKECEEKTRIEYKYRDGFFTPKLKGINYLEVGRSEIIRNPITIIIEYLYHVYKKIRDAIKRLKKFLFPRRDKIYCNHIDSSLVGTIVHDTTENIPIHNLPVEFWGRTWWLQWRKLAEGYTAHNGSFSLPFDLRQARNGKIVWLRFEISKLSRIYHHGDQPSNVYDLFHVIKLKKKNLIGMRYNLRTIKLPYWEYMKDSPTPRVEDKNAQNILPEVYSEGRVDALVQQIIPIELTKAKHMTQIKEARDTIDIYQIQKDYPENLTVCIESKLPGHTRGDEWFGMRMMNGMNCGYFLPDKLNPAEYWIKYFGKCNYNSNDEYALPTAEIKFKIGEKGFPLPIEIHLTGQLNAFNKDPWQKRVIRPADGDVWLYAKRLVRICGSVATEVDEHFTGTHLNTEQYAIAAYRNLRLSPVAALLLPHLKEASIINKTADKLLITQFLPSATGITRQGYLERTRDLLGVHDWKNWAPMEPLNDKHSYALAEDLFWKVTGQYVDEFFEINAEKIREQWDEIYHFSDDLVKNSVPVFLSNVDWTHFPENEKKVAEERLEYYTKKFRFDTDAKRTTLDGQLKAVSPITMADNYINAAKQDWENLKAACKYIIMMATFMHTWINEHQYDDLGEILYNGGGLRFGEKEHGVLAPETDFSIAPDLTISTQQMWFVNLLSRTEYGFITQNEETDINPLFIKLLEEKRKEFLELGVEIDKIESRTNI